MTQDELRKFERHCPAQWWPMFGTMFYTGLTLSEAQALRGADVRMVDPKRMSVHEHYHRLKTVARPREVPIPKPLESVIAGHLARVSPGSTELVFPGDSQVYRKLRRVWDRTCTDAGIADATRHHARHTFGVHAAMSGKVPVVRLQKLMGHATPYMTLRYMARAPDTFMDEDGAAIAEHMTALDAESEARAGAARAGMRAS